MGSVAVQYRAFVLGKAWQILTRHDFDAPDDEAAITHGRQYVIRDGVEVWQLSRLVETLDPSKVAA
jgi:hypothetical protein